ncbi:terpene synthase family protein [Streptomyces rapamycinicus]|nr:hypothetical protein LIV37_51320 [Streptomyces rapamycinicus NRRL 5491]
MSHRHRFRDHLHRHRDAFPTQIAHRGHGAWTNELLSLPREAAAGETTNYVIVLKHAADCGLEAAVRQVTDRMQRRRRRWPPHAAGRTTSPGLRAPPPGLVSPRSPTRSAPCPAPTSPGSRNPAAIRRPWPTLILCASTAQPAGTPPPSTPRPAHEPQPHTNTSSRMCPTDESNCQDLWMGAAPTHWW